MFELYDLKLEQKPSAYYMVHTQTGNPPYVISLHNHKGIMAGIAFSIESAQQWVKQWNLNCTPNPYRDEYRNEMIIEYKPDGNLIHTLAPTTTCTSNAVPCQKGNNPMYIDDCQYNTLVRQASKPSANATNVVVELKAESDGVSDQRKYLERRISDLKFEKAHEISALFHEYEPYGPKTIKELKERLKKGLFTVLTPKNYDELEDEVEEDEDSSFYWRSHFSWRTEDTQFDKTGYQAASDELTTFVQGLYDQVKILDPTLSLLDDLKKWKPTKAKK
jgi:hypothetical protein